MEAGAQNKTENCFKSRQEFRVLIIAKDYNLKAALGNFLLQERKFDTTADDIHSKVACTVINNRKLVVINAPRILDQGWTENQLKTELQRLYFQATPGPHVMLYVSQQYESELDKEALARISAIFGAEIVSRTIFVFHEFGNVSDFSLSLRRPVRFQSHICVSYESSHDHDCLLYRIEDVICRHGYTYFVNDMLIEAERFFQEHTNHLLAKTHAGKEFEFLKKELQEMKSKMEADKQKIHELENRITKAKTVSDQTEETIRDEERERLINDETLNKIYRGIAYVSEKLILHGIIAIIKSYF